MNEQLDEFAADRRERAENYDSHRARRHLVLHRHESGEVTFEQEVCDECGVQTPKLEWFTCDEWRARAGQP